MARRDTVLKLEDLYLPGDIVVEMLRAERTPPQGSFARDLMDAQVAYVIRKTADWLGDNDESAWEAGDKLRDLLKGESDEGDHGADSQAAVP